jgi:lysophospholipase L1-like esterase
MAASRHLVSFIVLGVISFELFLDLFFTTTPLLGQIVLSDYNAAHPLKIMAIGDSITDDCSYNGAWREYLQPLLQSNGYAFTFVGRQVSSPVGNFTERRHEGYCGAVIAAPGVLSYSVHGYPGNQVYLQKIIADALTNSTPDVVLIVMGANDIGRGRDPFHVATNDMPQLVDLILSNAPAANIILTKTTTLRDAALGYAPYATNVPVYNAALQAMVRDRAAAGQQISLADMFSVVNYGTMFNSDHLHPNPTGLNAMAKEFLTRIQLITVRSNPVPVALVPAGSVWKYSDTGQDLGTNWVQPDFDDANWNRGNARFGYGDTVAFTTISFGSDSKQKQPTTYFRTAFVVLEGFAFTNLNFRTAFQDGIVVWLNGREAYRSNLPNGPISYTNLALKRFVVDGPYIFNPTNLVVPFLPPGTNVLAVELHLNSPAMPSAGFDMELLATGYPISTPSLSVNLSTNQIQLRWLAGNSISYSLFSTTNLVDTTWVPETAPVRTNGAQCVVTISPDAASRFFRLQKH